MYVNESSNVPDEVKRASEKTLKAMKSGAYKDAFADQLRSEGLRRPMKATSVNTLREARAAMKVLAMTPYSGCRKPVYRPPK